MMENLIKSMAISFTFISLSFIIAIFALGVFIYYVGNKFVEVVSNIPLYNSIVYGGLATALTWINKKYKYSKRIY